MNQDDCASGLVIDLGHHSRHLSRTKESQAAQVVNCYRSFSKDLIHWPFAAVSTSVPRKS